MTKSLFYWCLFAHLVIGGWLKVRAEEPGRVVLGSIIPPPILSHEPVQSQTEFIEVDGQLIELPPLEQELLWHSESSLYESHELDQGCHQGHSPHCKSHGDVDHLRLPECWQEPQPLSLPYDYLGSHVVPTDPFLKWKGCEGNRWEPRLVGYGSYELFAAAYESNNQRRDGIGHQLVLDFDLSLTGAERLHVQFRPLGEENSGGSFWRLSNPQRYDDNSTGVPQRWWIEGELQSLFGGLINNEQLQLDINVTAGRFPMQLHNNLLMNDEIIGVMLGKNTFTSTPLSNINIQAFYAFDEVDSFPGNGDLYGVHLSGDYRHAFLEATFARIERDRSGTAFESNYFAVSGTKFFGPLTLAGRAMFKAGSGANNADGQLYVIESSFTRTASEQITHLTGIGKTVSYINLFHANDQWTPISGGNFDRIRNAFTVNPLLNLSAQATPVESHGISIGSQLFRHHQDESIIPEVAYEERSADSVWGIGIRYQRKLTSRSYLELRGIKSWSNNIALQREGLFCSTFILF